MREMLAGSTTLPGTAKCATNTHKVAHGPGNTKAFGANCVLGLLTLLITSMQRNATTGWSLRRAPLKFFGMQLRQERHEAQCETCA